MTDQLAIADRGTTSARSAHRTARRARASRSATPRIPVDLTTALAGAAPRRRVEACIAAVIIAVYLSAPGASPVGGDRLVRATANAAHLVDVERRLGVLVEPAIQDTAMTIPGLVPSANVAYGTLHFVVTPVVLIGLFRWRRACYTLWRNTLAFSSLLAFGVCRILPVAPPRLAGGHDGGPLLQDTLSSHASVWSFDSPFIQRTADPLAAMPSMHVGWAIVCAAAIASTTVDARVRRVACAYPVAITATIVITGNHYLADALGGLVVVTIGHGLARAVRAVTLRQVEAVRAVGGVT